MYPYFTKDTLRNQVLLTGLEVMIDEWRDEFECRPQTKLEFAIDSLGMLLFNGIALCPVSQIDSPESLSCDCELFTLRTNVGEVFELYIEWPYAEEEKTSEPYLSRITKLRDLYTCTDNLIPISTVPRQ